MVSKHRTSPKLKAWAAQVDHLMRQDWCIGINDAGLSDDELLRYWRSGEEPAEFVAWFAEKYDLIRFERAPAKSS
jgi:hypothetical protein